MRLIIKCSPLSNLLEPIRVQSLIDSKPKYTIRIVLIVSRIQTVTISRNYANEYVNLPLNQINRTRNYSE